MNTRKTLAAATLLVTVAGSASADVKLIGGGFFGLTYEKKANTLYGEQSIQLLDRLQIDVRASKKTDSGLTFHGKFRIRSERDTTHPLAPTAAGPTTITGGQVGVKAGGLNVSVGNVNDAVDKMATYYHSELGLCACGGETLSVPLIRYDSYNGGHNGVLAVYNMGAFTLRGSWETRSNVSSTKGEGALSARYVEGPLSLEAGYVHQSAGGGLGAYTGETLVVEDSFGKSVLGFAGGHNASDSTGVGNRNYKGKADPGLNKTIFTVYGNARVGANTTLAAFFSQAGGLDTVVGETTKTSYGVGASYALGSGASLVGHVRTDRRKDVLADLGVEFKF